MIINIMKKIYVYPNLKKEIEKEFEKTEVNSLVNEIWDLLDGNKWEYLKYKENEYAEAAYSEFDDCGEPWKRIVIEIEVV